jgi:hypothetical protein
MPALRPLHAKPAEQVPAPAVPQHGWPAPPQVPHWLPVAETKQDKVVPHAACMPPSGPPFAGQQGWPVPPQVAHIPGTPLALFRPAQARPVEQVPALPVPQHGCPGPPHVPQISSTGAEMQLIAP